MENNTTKNKYVSEIIGEDYLNWNNGDVVLLKAGTGRGKTQFVLDKLIKSLNENESVLYLSNRNKLKSQIEDDLINNENKENVTIMNYQALESILKFGTFNFNQYKYVICDEIHYIISDSSFNASSILIYEHLIEKKHSKVIKVMMSATMDIVEDLIKNVNKENFNNIYEYDVKTNYDYFNAKYYKKDSDLVQLIKNDKSIDKWLIFVTSISNGNKLLDNLTSKNIDAVFMHSNSESNYIVNGEFKSKVLIATSVIDNGVSLNSESIAHVVVNTFYKSTFIQMLGRVRVNINNPKRINLYLNKQLPQTFHTIKYMKLKPEVSKVDLFKDNYNKFCEEYSFKYNTLNPTIFKLEKGEWRLNRLGVYKLLDDYNLVNKTYTGLLNDGWWFIKEQLKWINMEDTFMEDKLIENVIDSDEKFKFEDYLNSLVGKKLFTEEQKELSDMIISELSTVNTKRYYEFVKFKPSIMESIIREQLGLDFAISKSKKETKGEMKDKRYIVLQKL